MNKKILAFAAVFGMLLGAWVFAGTATASATAPIAIESCHEGWYVNHDEGGADQNQGDRRPESTEAGFIFVGNQLMHHATNLSVDDLEPGAYEADPTPSLDSFFSVEVWGDDGGYATLRWNTATSKWDMVTGGQLYSDADPAALVKMPESHKATTVRSFGVGYVNSPNNGTETLVKSVTFAGTKYDLTCVPVTEEPSTPPTTAVPVTDEPTPGVTTTPVAREELPVTGAKGLPIVILGIALVGAGVIIFLFAGRKGRRNRRTLR